MGESPAVGDEVFHPKKFVSLFGPGDLGVFVMVAGSGGSKSKKECWLASICRFLRFELGGKVIVAALCRPPSPVLLATFGTSCGSGSLANRT